MECGSLYVDKRSNKGRFPSYNKPSVLGYFSLDGEHKYCNDLSQLKYLWLPPNLDTNDGASCTVNFDLDKGTANAIKKLDVCIKLDNLLKWIHEQTRNNEVIDADVVCYRGVLAMLMYTPFENISGWIICATRFQGTLYLCEYMTEEEKQKREQLTDREKNFLRWGYKFEQYMCSDTPNNKPDPLPPVNEREEVCVIFTTKLTGMRLLFGAEMDGVLSHTKITDVSGLAQAKFVELKTSRRIESHKQFNSFKRFKLLKWWCQNFLVGVEYLVCGFRNDEGIVQTLEQFHVLKLPRRAENLWDPNVCMNFCAKFLDFANHLVKEEDPDTVWKFEWKPHQKVMANKIKGPSEYSFLPKWYTETQKKKKKKKSCRS